jgi:hypothetical protein
MKKRWDPNNPLAIEDGEKRREAMAEWLDAHLEKRSRWRIILFNAAHNLAGFWLAISSALLGHAILVHFFSLNRLGDLPVIGILFGLTGLYLYRHRHSPWEDGR